MPFLCLCQLHLSEEEKKDSRGQFHLAAWHLDAQLDCLISPRRLAVTVTGLVGLNGARQRL